jgi:oligoendopeptidase F
MAEVMTREKISVQDTWDTASIYGNEADYERDLKKVEALVGPIQALRGKLTSPGAVAEAFRLEDELSRLIEQLYLYAHMIEDQDTTVGPSQARMASMRGRIAKIQGALAWIAPEILTQDEATLKMWAGAPELSAYRRTMELLARQKPHVLSAEEETILGLSGEVFSTPHQAFGMLTNADLTFEPAADESGGKHPVTNAGYSTLMIRRDRTLRRNAFGAMYASYKAHRNVLAALLAGAVKTHALNARLRHFESALEAALFPDNVPPSVYHALIEAVDRALPLFHEYVAMRGRRLGLDDLNMWDMHVPIVPEVEIKVEWAQCRRWILDSLKPLGDEYMAGAEAAFSDRWFDIWENKGKRSGAYSTGAYGHKPFMLLNYHGTLDDVFTVAHELGHSMHTWMSHKNQPYRYSSYPIFLAEIASTTNEALLLHHLLEIADDPKVKAYLLNHFCDAARGTLFRQTMFADFELQLHRRAEAGEASTAEALTEAYYALNAKHYGPPVEADERIGFEWLRIPHFYYNFYVYKYATGFSAAQVFSRRVLAGGEGCERYLDFLRSGCSRDPLDTVRDAGVDLSDAATVREAFVSFEQAVKALDAALEELG